MWKFEQWGSQVNHDWYHLFHKYTRQVSRLFGIINLNVIPVYSVVPPFVKGYFEEMWYISCLY